MNQRPSSTFIHCYAYMLLAVLLISCSALADTPEAAIEPSASGDTAPAADPVAEDDKLPVLAELHVTVTQKGDTPTQIKDAKVLITYDDGSERKGKTDKSGVVVLSDLPYGQVGVDVTSAGMQSAATEVLLDKPLVKAAFELKPRPIPTPSSD